MDIFEEDKIIFRSGGFISALKWSLFTFPILFILNFIGLMILFGNLLFGFFIIVVIPNLVIVSIYYFALKKGIPRFGLTTYSLRVEYVAVIAILVMVYSVITTLIISGKFEFPRSGIIPLVTMLFVPYFIKE